MGKETILYYLLDNYDDMDQPKHRPCGDYTETKRKDTMFGYHIRPATWSAAKFSVVYGLPFWPFFHRIADGIKTIDEAVRIIEIERKRRTL